MIGAASWCAAGIFVASAISYRAAWRCHRRPESTEAYHGPQTGCAAAVFLVGSIGFLTTWVHGGAALGLEAVLLRAGVTAACLLLQFPFVSYHAAEALARRVGGEALSDDEPQDVFARARAAQLRGDARGAVDLYAMALRDDPLRTEARIALAGLLAGSRRMAQAQEVVRSVLTRDDLPDADRAELASLLMKWESGGVDVTAPVGGGHQSRDVTTVRMEAHEQRKADAAGRDPSLPL